MRICLISREYPPDTGFGGIATFAYHLANGLKELGHEVEVVSLAKNEAATTNQNGIVVHRVEADGISEGAGLLGRYTPYSKYVLGTATALWHKFIELHEAKPFDVIDTPELLAEGLVPAITKSAPLVVRLYTPHSKFIAERFHNVTPSFDHQLVAMLERMAMIFADALTSPSDDLAAFVAKDLGYPQEMITIIRNPIDPAIFSPEGEVAIKSDGRKMVLFVGRLEDRKGIRHLVDAIPQVVKNHDNVRFIILGDDTNHAKGQKSVLAELKADLNRYGCNAHVEFIDRVPLAALPSYYRSADISIVPSLYDNSPYTCLEAMSCGKPVIGTSAGGTREYLVAGESGVIIPPADAGAIAESLLALLKDETERRRLGENARNRVLEHFQRTEIARQTLELYEQAGRSFVERHKHRAYLKPASHAFDDAHELLSSFEKMLYDELYRQSYRFRIRHWYNQVTRRPRLTMGKVILAASKSALKLVGYGRPGRNYPARIQEFEEDLRIKSLPANAKTQKEMVKQ